MRKLVYVLIFIIGSVSIADRCLALGHDNKSENIKDVAKGDPCVEKIYILGKKTPDLTTKVLPLYRFKPDVTGRFMKRFCDELFISKSNIFMTVDEIEKIYFPHSGNDEDYVYISGAHVSPKHIEDSQAAIMLSDSDLILLKNLTSGIVNMLHIEKDGDINVRYSEDYPIGMNDEYMPSTAIVHMQPDGKVNPIFIYDPRKDEVDRYGWITKYYTDNNLDSIASYEYYPESFQMLAFLSDSIPKKIEYNKSINAAGGKKEDADFVKVRFEDILKLKYNDYKHTYNLIFPNFTPEELEKRLNYYQAYYNYMRTCLVEGDTTHEEELREKLREFSEGL